jgi:hypothetical protein
MPKFKKKKLSNVLAHAVLSYCCAGDLKSAIEWAETPSIAKAIEGYSFYIEGLGEELPELLAKYIRERLKSL